MNGDSRDRAVGQQGAALGEEQEKVLEQNKNKKNSMIKMDKSEADKFKNDLETGQVGQD